MGKYGSDEQIKFFYKNEFLGSCDPDYFECDKLYELIKSDSRAATQVLNYMNSLGDPVFPTEEGGYDAETDVSKVDIDELYATFMQELEYTYADRQDMGFGFVVDSDAPGGWDFEIFDGPTVDDIESSTKIKASRYDNVPGYKAPESGYLYIFKHGIGPGTLPSDVEIIKTKDLPNYYTAVWLSDFLTTDELKKYDIPAETRINELLGRIGYCQKNGDVVPCDEVEACDNINGAIEPNSPDVDKTKLVHQVIKQAKEIRDYFQSHNNNLNRKQEQYLEDLSDGIDNESVAAIRDAIENIKYNSKNLRSEQYNLIMDLYDEFNLAGGKFEGMGYPSDDEVNACGDISCSTKVSAASNYDTKLIAKWLKAKFDDEAFGTAYTTHRISDADAYMGRNGLTYNRKNNTIDLWKSGGDEDIPVYKVVPQYSSTKRQGTYAPKMPKLIPIDEWNAAHNIDACSSVKANSYSSSRKRCTDVTKEVLDYTKKKYPALYKELSDKDIWITIWGDGEYSLSYNSIKDPNTFLSDSVKQDFMYTMEELYPGSFWGDLTDIDACDTVTASTDTSSIIDKIYSVMMNYEYGYDPDMTDINAMLQELTNKGVHVDTSDAFKQAWVSAHNKAERKTWGDSGDSMHYDSLTPGELEAIENYDTEYWEYVKDHPFNLKPASATDITSSTCTPKYMANMVSASSFDSPYDENDELYKYSAQGFLQKNLVGLMEEYFTNDFDELLTQATEMSSGLYIELTNQITGKSVVITPEDWDEASEYGEYPQSVYSIV